jgi:hypothetical protein
MVITKIQKYSFIMPSFSQNALGCAKTFALMGENFAEANLKLLKSK